jgi:hypothetical protein
MGNVLADPVRDPVARRALERGTGQCLGLTDVAPLPSPPPGVGPRAALESLLLAALQRPPCVVSFSGGRDSSAILAVAAHVARREGLALPIPVSLVFPHCASSGESEWQRLVVEHLNLPDWRQIEFDDELDIVGPVAQRVLKTHGLLWPFNTFFHEPIFEIARGGTVLSGVGGDEIFGSGWEWRRENQVLARARRPLPLDPVRMLISVGPRPVRAAFLRRRNAPARRGPDWLRPEAFAAVLAVRADMSARESVSFASSVRRVTWPRRSRVVGESSLAGLAADHDVVFGAPFNGGEFLAALVQARKWRMYPNRTAAMTALFGDLLPASLLARSDKAWFDTVFFHRHARAFAAEWDGSGLDSDYVDPDALRRAWLAEPEPDARTYLLLQQAWLASAAHRPKPASPLLSS